MACNDSDSPHPFDAWPQAAQTTDPSIDNYCGSRWTWTSRAVRAVARQDEHR